MFKIMHFPGATMLFIIGIFLLALYFIMGQKTKNNNKILGILYRSTFSLMIIGALFYMMHWPGSGFVRVISNGLMVLAFILLFRYKNQLLQSTKNITITFTVIGVLIQFSFFRFALTTLSFNYPIYLEKMEIANIHGKITEPLDLGYVNAKTKPELDSLKYYMIQNDKYLEKIGSHWLSEYCYIILENQSDTTILNHGLKWTEWIRKDDPYYRSQLLHIEYLVKLKRYQEALGFINNPKIEVNESDKKEYQRELNRLKKICLQNISNKK
jgi:hypothetical protein